MRVAEAMRAFARAHDAGAVSGVALILYAPDGTIRILVSDGFPIDSKDLAQRLAVGVPSLIEGDVTGLIEEE